MLEVAKDADIYNECKVHVQLSIYIQKPSGLDCEPARFLSTMVNVDMYHMLSSSAMNFLASQFLTTIVFSDTQREILLLVVFSLGCLEYWYAISYQQNSPSCSSGTISAEHHLPVKYARTIVIWSSGSDFDILEKSSLCGPYLHLVVQQLKIV